MGVKISSLPAVVSPSMSDIFPIVQGGVTYKETITQLYSLFVVGGGLNWSTVAGTTQAAAVGSGYVIGNAAQTTVTLPATAAVGSVVAVAGQGALGFILAANTGQTIKVAASTTSSGGSLTSAEQYDYVQVVCIVANTTWVVQSAVTTGFTIA